MTAPIATASWPAHSLLSERVLERICVTAVTSVAALCFSTAAALAGPPFLTDDPEPVDYHHYEFYSFVTLDANHGIGSTTNGPAFEFNYGALPNVQLHVIVPYTYLSVPSFPRALIPGATAGTTVSGFGDTEFGVKFRFVQETATMPQIGIFPMAEFPTGNSLNGIGNGRTWYRLPVWVQKSWGPWTTYGGGGYALNNAPGQTNYVFGGWLLQRDLSEHLTLGGEFFAQGAQFVGDRASTFYNLGGYLAPTKNFNILFSVGHTMSGDDQTIAYFALYWTGGPRSALGLADALQPHQAEPSLRP